MSQLCWVKICFTLSLQPEQYSYPSMFIYGHRASGKSHVMHVLLKELEVRATVSSGAQVFAHAHAQVQVWVQICYQTET